MKRQKQKLKFSDVKNAARAKGLEVVETANEHRKKCFVIRSGKQEVRVGRLEDAMEEILMS